MGTRSYVAHVCNVRLNLTFSVLWEQRKEKESSLTRKPRSRATSLVTSRSSSLAGIPSLSVVSTPEYVNDYVILLFAPAYAEFSGHFGALQRP